jgi:hypothetical protein
MKLTFHNIVPTIAGSVLLLGCSSGRAHNGGVDATTGATSHVSAEETSASGNDASQPTLKIVGISDTVHEKILPSRRMPKAMLYKTSGNYLNNVPVQLNADGTLLSYPSPTDIPENPTPLQLNDGWLLSPIGITAQSVFTRYTYAEYRALKQAPSPDELLKAVIPGAKVTATLQVPVAPSEALTDTAAVNNFIATQQLKIKL